MPISSTQPDKILWTCLPNGVNQNAAGGPNLRIAVLVSPRLGSFALFSDWPEIVPRLTFAVEIKQDPARAETFHVPATLITLDPAAALDPKLWASLFPPTTFVRPHDPTKPGRYAESVRRNGIQTYGLRNVAAYIKEAHQNVEPSTAHQLPTALHPTLAKMATDIGPIATNEGDVRKTLFAAMARTPRITSRTGPEELNLPSAGQSTVNLATVNFARLHAYRTRALSTPPVSAGPQPPPTMPKLDFHQIVSSLGDYPLLLRRLGLILDLEIPFTVAVPSDSQLRLVVSGGGLPPQDPQPWTCYLLTDVFLAKPASPAGPGSLHDGVIDLKSVNDNHALNAANPFEIVQIDPERAGAKLLNLSVALARGGLANQEAVGMPAMHSAGLSLAKTDRHIDVESAITNAESWHKPGAPLPILQAEDLLRGYRIDVLDETQGNTWHSLCARQGTYKLRDGSLLDLPADEGYVKAASTSSQYAPVPEHANPADPASLLYMHECIFRWTGWSLCAGRPGKTIMDQGTAQVSNDAQANDDVKNANPTGLSVDFQPVPGSLPRLRFGHSYRIRLRAVDLAGGGLRLQDPPNLDSCSDPVVYARFDPIAPPTVVLTDVVSEGESLERLVIRSNYNETATQYASDPTVQKALDGRQYAPTNDRHMVPPKSSLQMAETHGVFDHFIGPGASDQSCDSGYKLALREAGTLEDTVIVDVSTGATSIQVQGLKIVKTDASGRSVIHTEPQLRTPYLPDVIARGASLSGIPGAGPDLRGGVATENLTASVALSWGGQVPKNAADAVVVKVPFSGTWPDTQPFRLRIAERPGTVPLTAAGVTPENYDETFSDAGQPQWDPAARVLTVFLGKGQTARIRYSSYPDLEDVLVSQTPAVPQLGYLHWWVSPVQGRPPFTQQQVLALAEFAAAGVNWQVSPFRELVLVHAVQQPLFAPTMIPQNPPVFATLGNTTVALIFTALFNALSTGKLDLLASWTEMDDLDEHGPKQISRNAHVGELSLEPPLTPAGGEANSKWVGPPLPFFGDTFAKFRSHHFGDTKFRSVDYFLRATTAFREYFSPAITADSRNITRDGPKVTIKVPNRSRPAAPKVLYAVPSFRWDPVRPRPPLAAGAKLSSRRTGCGLRVYLDRPWFSSGDGELLGVVLLPAGMAYGQDNPMKNVVTQWGGDPIFQTSAPPESEKTIPIHEPSGTGQLIVSRGPGPTVANFLGYRRSGTALKLDEEPGNPAGWTRVDVVGYEVEYDDQRKLWYADIQIDPGLSYCPFVRLALARYQPDSVPDAELSRVVLCDFGQLLPNRTTNVAVSGDGRVVQLDIEGVEPEQTWVFVKSDKRFGRNFVRVDLEMRDPSNPDRDIGWLPAGTAKIAGGRSGAPSTLWSGTITMPEPAGSGKYRIVVQEAECYYDDNSPEADPTKGVATRLVYADTIDL
ncbi:MAG: hypothetical protein JO251_05440 [Verrucomicrobia bacterium]|nr:hypothetical protein [Verrucomicrobiota bacterium]